MKTQQVHESALRAALAEAALAEEAANVAASQLEAARQRADDARRIAEQQRTDRQRAWAEATLAGYPDHQQAISVRIEDAKRTFDRAVIDDFLSAGRAFLAWYDTLSQQHVSDVEAHRAGQILDRAGFREPNAPPNLNFADECSRALTHAGLTAFDDRTRAAIDRRTRVFDGFDEGTTP